MATKTNKVQIHSGVTEETEKNISLLALGEKRSVSAMIRVLIEEAIEARLRKVNDKT